MHEKIGKIEYNKAPKIQKIPSDLIVNKKITDSCRQEPVGTREIGLSITIFIQY